MYQATEACAAKIMADTRTFAADIRIEGERIQAQVQSLKYHAGCNAGNTITLGSAVSAYIELTVYKPELVLQDKEIQVLIGFDGEEEWIPLGYFTVEKPTADGEDVSVTAYDRMKKLERPYFSKLSYPADTNAMLQEISQLTGVPVSLPGSSVSFPQKPEGYTAREVVSYLAQLLGCFAVISREGKLELKWYQDISYPLDQDRYWPPYERAELDYSVNRLECAVGREEGEDGTQDKILSAGAGLRGISLENPFMTQTILNQVYEKVKGFQYRPGNVTAIGDPRMEPGDIVTINDGKEDHLLPVMSLNMEWDGGLSMELEAVGNTETEEAFRAQGPTAKALDRAYTELFLVNRIVANKIDADIVEANYVKAETFEGLKADFDALEANTAEFEDAAAKNFTAVNGRITNLTGDFADFKTIVTGDFTAVNGEITNLSGELSTYKTQVAGQFTAFDADITNLKAKDAQLEQAVIGKAGIADLEAIRIRTGNLETDVAGIHTLVNGNLTSDNIASLTLTAKNTAIENGMIKNAMIESLAFDKIIGIDVNTTKLTVHSEDGKSTWTDNTIQISDASRVRVQIGEDASGDYTLAVWDASGKLIWDALGATEHTIQRKIIKDAVVADDAAIQGKKLDIESVVREVNGAVTKLKSTTILLDDKKQTLDVAFSAVESTVVSNLSEAKTYADGKASDVLSSAKGYADSKTSAALSDAQSYALAQANSALASAKTYADAAADRIEVGGRNLLLGTGIPAEKEKTETYTTTNFYKVYAFSPVITNDPKGFLLSIRNGYLLFSYDVDVPEIYQNSTDSLNRVGAYFAFALKNTASGTTKTWYGTHSTSGTATGKHDYPFRNSLNSVSSSSADAPNRFVGHYSCYLKMSEVSALKDFYANPDQYEVTASQATAEIRGISKGGVIKNVQLITGRVETDWSPAPEDTEAEITNLTEITTTHTTSINTMQGQIESLISEDTAIKGDYNALVSRYNTTAATVNRMQTTIGEHTTLLDSQGEDIIAVQSKANTIASDLAGTKQTVSTVQSTLTATQSRVSTVETGLDGLKTRVSATETAVTKKADGTAVDSLTSRVATCESTLDGFETSLTATNKTVSDNYTALNSKIDEMEVGGRNLAFKTAKACIATATNASANNTWLNSTSTAYCFSYDKNVKIESGEIYVLSFDYVIDWSGCASKDEGVGCGIGTGGGGGRYEVDSWEVIAPFKKYGGSADSGYFVYQMGAKTINNKYPYFAFRPMRSNADVTGAKITITNFKLEKGTKATDWTPAPEDVESELALLNTAAATHTEQISAHDTRITAAENAISLKVSSSDFNSYKTTVTGAISTAKTEAINTAASDATTKANNAKTAAISAAATDAKTKADKALADARTYTNAQITTVNKSLSTTNQEINVMKGQIALKVEQTDIDTAVQNIQVGGRNLTYYSKTVGIWYCAYGDNRISSAARDSGSYTVNGYLIERPYKASFVSGSSGDMRFGNTASGTGDATASKFDLSNKTYTMSVWVMSDADCTLTSWITRQYKDSDGSSKSHTLQAGIWTKIEHTRTFSSRADTDGIRVRFTLAGTVNILFCLGKTELGNKATDWSPAPEDVDASITAVDNKFSSYSTTTQMNAAITAAKDSITSSVSKTYATKTELSTANGKITTLETWKAEASQKITKDGIIATVGNYYAYESDLTKAETRLTTAESTIKQHTTDISLRVKEADVTGNYVIGKINLSSTTATIEAKHINLTGAVTISALASDAKAQIDNAATALNRATYHYADCGTAAATAAKTAALSGFSLYTGAIVSIRFNNGNTAASPTLNVNGTGAKPIVINGTATPTAAQAAWSAYDTCIFTYDGSQWRLTGTDATVRAANNAQSTANTAKTTADTAYAWTNANGANMTNLRAMVLKWTNNAVSTSTCIQGGWIATNTITANKLAIADFINYAQLNEYSCTAWGFSKTADSSGSIYQMNTLSRDKFISEYQTVNGGETFRIKGQISTSVKGNTTSGGTDSTYRGTAIGIYCYDGSKKTVGIVYSTRVTGSSSAPWTSIDATVTIPTTARYIRVFVQTESYGNFSGTLKVRNIEVLRAASGELIVDGAVTAAKIAAGSITASNGIIADAAITTAKIANLAVTNAKLANLSVTNAKIADATIESAKIKSIDAGKITTGTLDAARIGAGAITADKIAVGDFTNYATVNENMAGSMLPSTFKYGGTRVLKQTTYTWIAGTVNNQQFLFMCNYTANSFKTGDVLRFRFIGYANTAQTIKPGIFFYDENKSNIGYFGASVSQKAGAQTSDCTVKITSVPSGTVYYLVGFQFSNYADGQLNLVTQVTIHKISGRLQVGNGYIDSTGAFQIGPMYSINNNTDVMFKKAVFVKYGMELYGANDLNTPYIDFHYGETGDEGNSNVDFSARITNTKDSYIAFQGKSIAGSGTVAGCTIYAQSVTQGSDRRLKTDIRRIREQEAEQFLLALNPCSYVYRNDLQKIHHGLIYDEVRSATKAWDWDLFNRVYLDDEEYGGLCYMELIADMISVIQADNGRIKEQARESLLMQSQQKMLLQMVFEQQRRITELQGLIKKHGIG